MRPLPRYRSRLLWACEHFSDLKAVRRVYGCSSALLHRVLMEVVEGKENAVLKAELVYIPGRENVRWVALDLSDGYRNFARDFFPNAQRRLRCGRATLPTLE